ncbi:MAG TPA: hypothetical protein VJ463_05865 [Geothrix sp.]|nr:hypothetical protein [Geothrix sp.]
MTRSTRILAVLLFGGSLLMAQIPNPLNLPDPLGLSRQPAPAQAPREGGREGRRVERKARRESRPDQGKHKGQAKHRDGGRKGHGRR